MKRINIIAALLILVFTSNVFAADKSEDKRNKVKKNADKVSEKIDTEMTLESWMTELKAFNPFQNTIFEKEICMESWMTKTFEVKADSYQENEMEMEEWMTKSFEKADQFSVIASDNALEMEEWMTKTFTIN